MSTPTVWIGAHQRRFSGCGPANWRIRFDLFAPNRSPVFSGFRGTRLGYVDVWRPASDHARDG